MKGKMAIIGDGDSVLAFSAVGIDAYPVKSEEGADKTIKELASKYKIIFVTEKVAKQNEKRIAEYANVPYPIILPVPSGAKGGEQFGMQGIYNAMEKALGINIFAQEDAQSANKNDEKEN